MTDASNVSFASKLKSTPPAYRWSNTQSINHVLPGKARLLVDKTRIRDEKRSQCQTIMIRCISHDALRKPNSWWRRYFIGVRQDGFAPGKGAHMDGQRFDRFTRLFASGISRRNAIKGLFGIAGGAAVAQANAGSSFAQSSISICHFPPGNPGNVKVIEIPDSDLPSHTGHGDFIFTDCCTDSECGAEEHCCRGICCPETRSCNPSGPGCCVGLGDIPDGGDCGGFMQSGDAECCSGLCNEYVGQCFLGCLPNLTPSAKASECCSGTLNNGFNFGRLTYCAAPECIAAGSLSEIESKCCSEAWWPDHESGDPTTCNTFPLQ